MSPVRTENESKSLSKQERFDRADYRRVFDEGKSFPSRYFVMWVLPIKTNGDGESSACVNCNDGFSLSKLGTVVSKKTFRHAVDRNRARRLMREAFRLSKEYVGPGRMILLLGRKRIVDSDVKAADVVRDFRLACKKAGLKRGVQ